MPERVLRLFEHHRLYRILVYGLPVVAVLAVVTAALGSYQVVRAIQADRASARRAEVQAARIARQAKAVAEQHVRDERTIRFLCNRDFTIEGIVQTMMVLALRQRPFPGRQAFLDSLTVYHIQLIQGITEEGSPCVH